MLGKNLRQQISSAGCFAAVVKHARAKRFDQRVIRFDLCSFIKFSQGVCVSCLIHENARAIVADDDPLSRIQTGHSIKTAQRFFVVAIQSRQHGAGKVHTNVIRSFVSQFLGGAPGLLLFSPGHVDKDHVHARLEQFRIDGQRSLECFLRARVVIRFAQTFANAVGVGATQCALSQGK